MKVFSTMEALKEAPETVYAEMKALIDNMSSEGDIDVGYENDENFFSYMLGGDVYVVETVDDLKEIQVLKSIDADGNIVGWLDKSGIRAANITEAAGDFDAADFILPDNNFIALFMATNNSGGNVYYIPKEVFDQCPNIVESVRLTHNGGLAYHSARRELSDQCKTVMPDGSIIKYGA